jgi:hypothetical protein
LCSASVRLRSISTAASNLHSARHVCCLCARFIPSVLQACLLLVHLFIVSRFARTRSWHSSHVVYCCYAAHSSVLSAGLFVAGAFIPRLEVGLDPHIIDPALLLFPNLCICCRPVCGWCVHPSPRGWAGPGSGTAQGQLHAAVLQVCVTLCVITCLAEYGGWP